MPYAFPPGPHEFDPAAGHDVCLERVGAKVREQLDHGLIDHFGVQLAGFGMLRRCDPVLDDLLEFVRRHTRMGGHDDLESRFLPARERTLDVALEQ